MFMCTWFAEEVMHRHGNYKRMIDQAEVIQSQYEQMLNKSGESDDQKEMRNQKDKQIKLLKFVGTICNRALYHLQYSK